ncbi:MAG: HEAT repeat domain-containing protein [Pseudomonadota bacterium]
MSSKSTLEYAATSDKDPNVRIAAIQQLDSKESKSTLEYIATSDKDPNVRIAALRQLKA